MEAACKECNAPFNSRRSNHIFCGPRCLGKWTSRLRRVREHLDLRPEKRKPCPSLKVVLARWPELLRAWL